MANQLDIYMEKKKRKMLTPYKIINSRSSTDPRKKCAIIHLSEYNTGEYLHYLGIEKDFLNVTKKALINHNRILLIWTTLKLITSGHGILGVKRQADRVEECICNSRKCRTAYAQGVHTHTHTRPYIQTREQTTQKKWARNGNRHFTKEYIQMANKPICTIFNFINQGNSHLKTQDTTVPHQDY